MKPIQKMQFNVFVLADRFADLENAGNLGAKTGLEEVLRFAESAATCPDFLRVD